MGKPRILLQLDADRHASVFDAVTALDAGAEQLLQYHGVEPGEIRDLVHGAMFTRGPAELKNTAVFIGGSRLSEGEALLEQVRGAFFGPLRVSVMLDSSGANTTAAAAVLSAAKHGELQGKTAAVLAATGPVGGRVARLLAGLGVKVRAASRSLERAEAACGALRERIENAEISAWQTLGPGDTEAILAGADLVFACGAAGAQLVSAEALAGAKSVKIALDLNAVPPVGIEGIDPHDKAAERGGLLAYGALGVGGLKMKIHKAAIAALFERNDAVLDAEEILALGQSLLGSG